MDPQRSIRFLYPPLVLLGFVLFGIRLDPAVHLTSLIPAGSFKDVPATVGALAGGGLLLIVIGYVLGVLSHGAIYILSSIGVMPYIYQAPVSDSAITRIRQKLKVGHDVPPQNVLLPVAVFDHTFLHPAVHDWIQRRWQLLHTSINSTTALAIGLLLGPSLIGLRDWRWIVGGVLAMLLFVLHAVMIWDEAKGMLEFQSHGPFPVPEVPPKPNEPKSKNGA